MSKKKVFRGVVLQLADGDLPDHVRNFIFEFIDSVELLEVLLLLSSDPSRSWSSQALSNELRSNSNSIDGRLNRLKRIGLIQENPSAPGEYNYKPGHPSFDKTVTELAEAYSTKRHRILEMIFSPLKQARVLADAFRISAQKPGKGDDDA